MNGKVERIFIAPDFKQPMQEVNGVLAIVGAGLEGDRYFNNRYINTIEKRLQSRKGSPNHATVIRQEDIDYVATHFNNHITAEQTRRNIVISGLEPFNDEMIGTKITIGEVVMRITERCTPCHIPAELAGRGEKSPEFVDQYPGWQAGARVEILTTGPIQRGNDVKQI